MEARFRMRMDRSLDEIAAEMHSEQAQNPFGQVYKERVFVGAEPSFQRLSNSRRYAPYPDISSGACSSLERDEDLSRSLSQSASHVSTGSSDANTRLFVGNLSYKTSWQTLKEHMRRAGPVHKCDVFTEACGKSKGMGLVQYESAESAERALLELQESALDGRRLFLRKHMDPIDREKAGYKSQRNNIVKPPSNPAATVFIQNLDYSVTWQKLKDVFKVAGKVINVDLAKDRDGKSKGYASVQFSEPAEAINAIALFHGQMLSDRPMKLKMDSSSPYQPDPIQLRLSGLAGVTRGMQAPPLAPLPPPSQPAVPLHMPSAMSLGEAPPTSSINVPFLSAVISSLTAEKLAAILIQNSALGPSSIVGSPGMVAQQQLQAPPISHPLFPFHVPPISQLGSMSPGDSQFSNVHRAEKYSQAARSSGVASMDNTDNSSLIKRVANGEFANIQSPPSCKVFVNNLNFNTSWHYLRNLFKTAGPVRHVEIFKNSSGKSKGCGIVIFYDTESALKAIRMFNNMHVDGRKLSVDHDRAGDGNEKF